MYDIGTFSKWQNVKDLHIFADKNVTRDSRK